MAAADRIGDLHEHDWHGARRLLERRHGRAARAQDDVWRERDQFRRIRANALDIGPAPAKVDPDVAAINLTQFLQPLREGCKPGR